MNDPFQHQPEAYDDRDFAVLMEAYSPPDLMWPLHGDRNSR